MALISTRIPDEFEKQLDWYSRKEKIGRTIAFRKILESGLKQVTLEYALDLYQKGRITLWKSAEIAGLSLWEMLDIVREKKIPMYYTLEDAEKDIKASLKE